MPGRLKLYVAGKVSKDSSFGTHDWRDNFCAELVGLSGLDIQNLDPTKAKVDQNDPHKVFACDCYLISRADALVVYLTDDISVGGSQEILIAKYFHKPVIGLAPHGGKFNGSSREYFGQVVHDYKDPFVFSTCDVVCKDIQEVAEALRTLSSLPPKGLKFIDEAIEDYKRRYLGRDPYVKHLFK